MTIYSLYKNSFIRTAVVLTLVLAILLAGFAPGYAAGTPYTSVVSVSKDVSVTITGYNFPVDQTFTVRMGAFGTLGVGGTVVGTKEPSSSTTFTATYNIPATLVGASKIAIRFDSPQGYYAYDWFVNSPQTATATKTPGPTVTPGGPTSTPGPTKTPGPTATPLPAWVPTFSITGVKQGLAVSILTENFPANQTFTVRMGDYGTLGIGGTIVGTIETGSGGAIAQTFSIPALYAARDKIAIRLDSNLGYYSYNWFYNAPYGTTGATATLTATPAATSTSGPTATAAAVTPTPTANVTPAATATPSATAISIPAPVAGYVGIPVFYIDSVVRDSSVTISGYNFPPGQTFTVRMGEYGTMGVGGVAITTYESGAGGNFTTTFSIPASLAGSYRIAIRLDSATGYYYSYNWFYNN